MSVILDALHKARGDKSGRENQSKSVARVVEAQRIPTGNSGVAGDVPRISRAWIPAMIIFGGIMMLFLVAGVLYFLFVRLQQLDVRDRQMPAAPVMTASQPAAVASVPVPALPTPLPLQDLPIAGQIVSKASVTDAKSTDKAVEAAPDKLFSLGSIVCENNDCLALINGRTAHVGDVIKGYKIIGIGPSSVTMMSPSGESVNLSLFD